MFHNISSERIYKLLIELEKPSTPDEIKYIENLKKSYENKHLNILSPECLSERKKLVKNWRESELILGATPKTTQEENFVKLFNKTKQQAQESSKDFNERKLKALNEIDALLKSSNFKNYASSGYFNSKEFKEIELKVNELAEKQTKKDITKITNKLTHMDFNSLLIKNKIKILKKEFNINWKPIEEVIDKEFLMKYNEIKKKYNLLQIDLL